MKNKIPNPIQFQPDYFRSQIKNKNSRPWLQTKTKLGCLRSWFPIPTLPTKVDNEQGRFRKNCTPPTHTLLAIMWVKKLLKSLGLRGGSRVLLPTAGFPTPQSGEGGPWRKHRIMTVKPMEFVCRIQYELQTLNQRCQSLKASILPEALHVCMLGPRSRFLFYVRHAVEHWKYQKQQLPKSSLNHPTLSRQLTLLERWWHMLNQEKTVFQGPLYYVPLGPQEGNKWILFTKQPKSHTSFNLFSPVDIQGISKSVSAILTKKKNEFAL